MGYRVMVVDDDSTVRGAMEEMLLRAGYETRAAESHAAAVEALRMFDPHVIVTDIFLGDATGLDLLMHVMERNLSAQVVMITGAPSVESAAEAVRLGAFDYIKKPVSYAGLSEAVRRALEKKLLLDDREDMRANLDAVFHSVEEAIVSVDPGFRIKNFNRRATELLGISDTDVGADFRMFSSGCARMLMPAVEGTVKFRKRHELRRAECVGPQGVSRVLGIRSLPLVDRHGRFLGAAVVVSDDSHVETLERQLQRREGMGRLVGSSEPMQRLYAMIESLAHVNTTVLITGEPGTGKRLVAEAIHYGGSRRGGAFVEIDCTVLHESISERDLVERVWGADTLFLRNVPALSPSMQARLVRVLERRPINLPAGKSVRLMASASSDIALMLERGTFRKDLYYWLKVVEIRVPTLLERTVDIPALAERFLVESSEKLGKGINGIAPEALDILMKFPWPGNVLQLRQAVEHAAIRCRGNQISADDLPENIAPRGPWYERDSSERGSIVKALVSAGWNKAKASRALGFSRKTLYQKLRKYGIEDEAV